MNLALESMKDIFKFAESTHSIKIKSRKNFSVTYGIKATSFVGVIAWKSLPSDIKECNSFQVKNQKVTPGNCPCKLCKNFLHETGYVQIL